MGDPSGIGPEIVAKALRNREIRESLTPIVFADASLRRVPPLNALTLVEHRIERDHPDGIFCQVTTLSISDRVPGKPTSAGGRAQLAYIEAAIEAAKGGWLDSLCTAPVSKEQITRTGFRFMGHTEFLAAAFKTDVLMLMHGPRLRVALATNHLPLRDVSSALSVTKLKRELRLLSRTYTPFIGRKPRIAVCALNPHAGEGGMLGDEEVRVIGPAIKQARRLGVDCDGPFAADGLFAHPEKSTHDVVLAMFHDQGLVAAKALDFSRTVNVTLGLPLPRTSPDHGVAYPLAGRRSASAEPMIAALLKAAELGRKHKRS